MAVDLNPQAAQMADESMVRTLAAQAAAIWPQEEPLLRRHALAGPIRVLDAGCGTGEGASRLARLFAEAEVLGVDVLEPSLALARERHGALAPRLRFEQRSIFHLGLPDRSFDLVTCRHVLQSIPHADQAIAELVRVTRPGGRLHLVAEDYGMIHVARHGATDPDLFWTIARDEFASALSIDMRIGRHAPGILRALGVRDVTVDYVVVDPLRVPRETFAAIWEAWRDGYVEVVAEKTRLTAAEVRAHFDDQIAAIRDPGSYACWMVPVVSGVAG